MCSSDLKPGMTGVGELVEIRDASGAKIARLVIGKEDKRPGSMPGPGKRLHFVRRAGQDPTYRVEIDTSKFTTRFDDWIEKDLLKLSPWDVRRVTLDDYALGAVESGGRMQVVQDRKDRIEVDVWAWGRGLESWLVDHIIIDGGPEHTETWSKLGNLLSQTWPHANGAQLGLAKLAIDTGYESPAVYAWSRRMGHAQVAQIGRAHV